MGMFVHILSSSGFMDLELLGTSAVKNLIAKTDRLKAFISEGDKEPFFDGAIYVYSSVKKNNESYDGRIIVQVKAIKAKNFQLNRAKYSISREMMDAYLKEGGIAFFLVLITSNGEKNKVFYNNLLPFKVTRYKSSMRKNSTKIQ